MTRMTGFLYINRRFSVVLSRAVNYIREPIVCFRLQVVRAARNLNAQTELSVAGFENARNAAIGLIYDPPASLD
jgi:hypothetical protein